MHCFSILQPAVDRQDHLIWEDQVKACLIGTTAFLALLLILVTCLCLSQRIRYERLLKAATTPASCFQDRQLSRANVPNTNIHADEGSNPIWMTGYDNEWYEKEDEQISDRSGGNSLDENAVTEVTGSEGEPTTPTDSLNGSGRCSDSAKNDKHSSLSQGIGRHLTPQKIILPSNNTSHKSSVKPNNNNNSRHTTCTTATATHNSITTQHAFSSSTSKKLTAPRPPISMPMPIQSHATLKSISGHNGNNDPSSLMIAHPAATSMTGGGDPSTSTTVDGSNHHEVTCKNSINTIYISSNSFKDATSNSHSSHPHHPHPHPHPHQHQHPHSPSSHVSHSQAGNNLSIISLETTEL